MATRKDVRDLLVEALTSLSRPEILKIEVSHYPYGFNVLLRKPGTEDEPGEWFGILVQ